MMSGGLVRSLKKRGDVKQPESDRDQRQEDECPLAGRHEVLTQMSFAVTRARITGEDVDELLLRELEQENREAIPMSANSPTALRESGGEWPGLLVR